jgi:methyl-accepting chemotaxis protein
MTDDTRDIAIEVRTKVEKLEDSIDKIEKDMRRLMSIVDQGSGIVGAARLLGFSTLGGAAAIVMDNWANLKKFFT